MSPRIAFLGTPEVAVPVLKALAATSQIDAVFCNPDRPTGRGRHLEAPPVKQAARLLGLDVNQPERWKAPETRVLWESLHIDLALVVAYGHILPPWMLDSCRLGAWNLHFSLLPKWRGASPVNQAILHGDPETGVSLMRLSPGLDEGPVLAQSRRPITLADDSESLLARLSEDAAQLLVTHLPELLAGTASTIPQDDARATFAPKLTKEMATLDCHRPVLELHRQVRALQSWPGTECLLKGERLKLIAVGAMRTSADAPGTLRWDKGGAWLTAGDGQAMELRLLQRPGKPVQPALQALQPHGNQGAESI